MLLVLLVFACLLLTIPIWIALMFPSLVVAIVHLQIPAESVFTRLFGGMDIFALMAMPFFIFAANLMISGGIARRLIAWALALVGHVRGGLGAATQLSCMAFGAVSGSSPATVAAIGTLMYPSMVEYRYPSDFNLGLISTSAAVALLIPPSITMIVYGAVTGVSIGALFIAGIMAGLVYGLVGLVYCLWYARRMDLPRAHSFSLERLLRATRDAGWAMGVPVLIVGGIYGGIFTPTEAAGVSAVYAAFVGLFIYREMDLSSLYRTCVDSAVTSAQVMILTGAGGVLGWVMTLMGAPQAVAQFVLSISDQPWVFLLIANVALLILGCFVDGAPAVVMAAPLLYPIATHIGVDPVHFGVVMTANIAIGMFTPPFGLNLLVASDVTGKSVIDLLPGCVPFFLVSLVGLAIITYVPEVSLWLPRLAYGP